MVRSLMVAIALALLSAGAGCAEDEPCDKNSQLVGTSCLPRTTDAAAPDGAGEVRPGGFGAPCTGDEQCTDNTGYCARMPGQPQGYCTATGCDKDPAKCPSGWSCLNLGMFAPGLPHMCARP